MKVWTAYHVQSGMLVKLKGETHRQIHAQRPQDSPTNASEHVTIELVEKEHLTPEELAVEQQALSQIGWALLEHRWIELEELRQKLE